ncbi:CHAD domain-containing protein [uncultured Microbacterium sp.]|uniref:CHAD domain-containing protein n=1 Tax=uncultured Microbacterium sp. TaxID=191216 RepID=UPI0028D065B1|nr:CHAD domain-containing protein [uncultured Microbacterium sp.]
MSHQPESLGALVQQYVGAQCQVLQDARDPLAARDESVVHPARVAIRRMRATLRTFEGVYDREDAAVFADELRWAGKLLGEVRDLLVLAERFSEDDSSAAAGARTVLAAEIDRQRAQAWDAVAEGLGAERGAALFTTIARWGDDPPFGEKADRPARRARKRVAKAHARLKKRLARAAASWDASPEQTGTLLHEARKAAKRHRYAVELALPVLGDDADETIERQRELQDALGAHQDAVVALAFLQRIDLDAQSRQTALALQELIGFTRAGAEDAGAVLRETERLRG